MKKFLYLMVAMLALVSCSNQEEIQGDAIRSRSAGNLETFAIYGEIHNEMLQYMSTHFTAPSTEPATKAEAIDYVLSVQRKCIPQLPISRARKLFIYNEMETYKAFYDTSDLMSFVQPDPFLGSSDSENEITFVDIKDMIQEALRLGAIDGFEMKAFDNLIDCVLANFSGKLSNEELMVEVEALIDMWESQYANTDFTKLESSDSPLIAFKDSPKGALSGVVLNISMSSLRYWAEEQGDNQSRGLPVFVGADIAGAIGGAVLSAAHSYYKTDKVDWGDVAWGAATSAVIASTGVYGKVGGWISKFFKKT